MKTKKIIKKRHLPADSASIIYFNKKVNHIDVALDEFMTDLLFYREISFCSDVQIFESLCNIRKLIQRMNNELGSEVNSFDKYSKINKKIDSVLASKIHYADFAEELQFLASEKSDSDIIKRIKGAGLYDYDGWDEECYYIKLCAYASKKKLLKIADMGLENYLEKILNIKKEDRILIYRKKVVSVLHHLYAVLEKDEETPLKKEIVKEVKNLWEQILK